MSETKAFTIIMTVLAAVGAFAFIAYSFSEAMISTEAAKAGLVQKVEGNKVIWVKP